MIFFLFLIFKSNMWGKKAYVIYLLYSDAQRALELLQQYRAKLDQRQQSQNRTKQGSVEEDSQLQQSLDRVINVFQSQLFSALLGKNLSVHSSAQPVAMITDLYTSSIPILYCLYLNCIYVAIDIPWMSSRLYCSQCKYGFNYFVF